MLAVAGRSMRGNKIFRKLSIEYAVVNVYYFPFIRIAPNVAGSERGMVSTEFDIAQVAEWARVELTETEKALFEPQLKETLAMLEQLGEVDTKGVEPLVYGCELRCVMREDVAVPGREREVFLAMAPERCGNEYKLPRIVEDA